MRRRLATVAHHRTMLAKRNLPALGEIKVDEVCPVRSASAPSSAVRSIGFARFVETIETCIAQSGSADMVRIKNNPAGALRRVRRGPIKGIVDAWETTRQRSLANTLANRRRPASILPPALRDDGPLGYCPRSIPPLLSRSATGASRECLAVNDMDAVFREHRSVPPGYWRPHAWKRGTSATREAPPVAWSAPTGPREGQAGPVGVAERSIRLKTPGNAGRGKGPQVWSDVGSPPSNGAGSRASASACPTRSRGRARFGCRAPRGLPSTSSRAQRGLPVSLSRPPADAVRPPTPSPSIGIASATRRPAQLAASRPSAVPAVMSGENLPLVGKPLGRRRHSTTAGYAHLADVRLIETTEKVGSIIARAMPTSRAAFREPVRRRCAGNRLP